MSMTDAPLAYRLSATLVGGHVRPVRAIALMKGGECMATAESYGDVKVFRKTIDEQEDTKRQVYQLEGAFTGIHEQEKLLYAVESSGDLFWSASGDNSIRGWTPSGDLSMLLTDSDKPNTVYSSIAFSPKGDLVTGSWDGMARVWRDGKCIDRIPVGQYAVNVTVLQSGVIVAGSADKKIVICTDSKHIIRIISDAHNHAVRKIIPYELGFASIGNDGVIKLWSEQGEVLLSFNAHVDSQVSFTYDLALLSGMEMASCGEDGTVRIFSADGKQLQKIHQPGPTYAVRYMENGDIVTACADRCVRIFTRQPERIAPIEELEKFEKLEQLAAATATASAGLDISNAGSPSDLRKPGKSHGEVRLIKMPDRGVVAYKWDQPNTTWEEIELAQAATLGEGKKSLNGILYDFVHDVEISPTKKLKLGWNRDEDPTEIATRFCTTYGISIDARDQIVQYVKPMCDEDLYKRKQEQDALIQQLTTLKHIPAWESGGYHLFGTCKATAMLKKFQKLNIEFHENKDISLDDNEMIHLETIISSFDNPRSFVNGVFTELDADIVMKIITMPEKCLLPSLDLLRMLSCHIPALKILSSKQTQIQAFYLNVLETTTNPVAISIIFKAICNFLGKRDKDPCERKRPGSLPQELNIFLETVLNNVKDRFQVEFNGAANIAASFVMFAYNIIVCLGRLQIRQSIIYEMCITMIFDLFQGEKRDNVLFYGLLTLGSISFVSSESKQIIQQIHRTKLIEICEEAKKCSNALPVEIANDIMKQFAL